MTTKTKRNQYDPDLTAEAVLQRNSNANGLTQFTVITHDEKIRISHEKAQRETGHVGTSDKPGRNKETPHKNGTMDSVVRNTTQR